jgi:uncharacterized protein (DUF3820 family)
MDDNSIMPFGIHQGKTLENVPGTYLKWLYDNNKCFGELKDYIKENLDAIEKEIKESSNKYQR